MLDAPSPHRLPRRGAGSLRLVCALTMCGLALLTSAAAAEPVTGIVVDGTTQQPIAGATVTQATEAGAAPPTATTGRDGTFLLDVPQGPLPLQISADGYETSAEDYTVPAGGIRGAVVLLFRPGAAAEVIEVEDEAPPAPPPPNQQNLRRDEITRIPGSRGDALQSVRSLPGVAATSNGGPGLLVIRGSAPDDSRITIDGVEVPIIYHFFGLQSVLPSEFISNIEFTPGGFGVEQGRSTGGIINVVTRDDVVPKAEGFAELSFINVAALMQAPLSRKHKVQVSAAIRRSIIDFILPAVIPDDTLSFTAAPTYYDAQLRLDWRPTSRDRLSLFGLTSLDNLALVNKQIDPNDPVVSGATFENETSFARVIGSWTHRRGRLGNRVTLSGGVGGFRVDIADRFLDVQQTSVELHDDVDVKLSDSLQLRAGAEGRLQAIDLDVKFPAQPAEGEPPPTSFSQLPLITYMRTIDDHVAGAYTALDYRPTRKATLTGGLRYDYYAHIGEWTLSPRAQLSYQLLPSFGLKAALGSYSRGLRQGETVPTNLEPERATQLVVGATHEASSGVSTTASVFYTDRRDLVSRDPLRAQTDPLNAYVNSGNGRSYGTELLVRVRRDNLFGWAAYTYSRSSRVDRPGDARRLFDADQPHNLIVVGSAKWGRWEFGGRFQYATGTPETPINGSVYLADSNIYLPTYGAVNSARIEDAHALDVRIDRRWRWGSVNMSAYLDITNVYAHARVLNYSYNYDFTQREAVTELPIVPSLGLRGAL